MNTEKAILLKRIVEKLQNAKGKDLLKIGLELDEKEALFILYTDTGITCAILFYRKSNVNYIAMTDSTGAKKGYSKQFIVAVLEALGGFIVCFSQPSSELIFGKSMYNDMKHLLNPAQLFIFWKDCFANRCAKCVNLVEMPHKKGSYTIHDHCYFSTWSNFETERRFPYNKLSELVDFEDDPKTKMKSSFHNISDLFNGLLVRKDFRTGGLLFSNCVCNGKEPFREDFPVTEKRIPKMLEFLRKADFSSPESVLKSSIAFIDVFSIVTVTVKPNGNGFIKVPKQSNEEIKIIKPRKV
ncbi:hypothetical protein GINT2_000512 [Glugoides intestinalis]